MRIIAGDKKGKRLFSPRGNDIRPTSDKVKGAIFNILMHDITGATVIDLFAGTGNLGIEALSRGAEKVYFIDNSGESADLIRKNISHCGVEDRSKVLLIDYKNLAARVKEKVDVVLIDPPYDMADQGKIFDALSPVTKEGSLLVLEHGKNESLPEQERGFELLKTKKYGDTALSIFKKLSQGSALYE